MQWIFAAEEAHSRISSGRINISRWEELVYIIGTIIILS